MKRVGLFFIVMIVGLMVVLIYNKLVKDKRVVRLWRGTT